MQKQETRPNTQYEVVIDPPKTQDLISNKYDIIPNPQSCIWPRHKTLYPMMMQKQNTNLQGRFLTGPPDFQYQNEKTCSANEELFYIENFVKN